MVVVGILLKKEYTETPNFWRRAMNNFEKIKTFSKNKMANFLFAILRSTCNVPKPSDCNKCVAKSLCDVERKRETKYSIVKWLESEGEQCKK